MSGLAGKQTIVITKPGATGGLRGSTQQLIMVTTASGLRAVPATGATTQAPSG